MIHFQYKGKGILVFVYALVPLITLIILTKLIEEYLFKTKFTEDSYLVTIGVSILISGFWTYYSSYDYYIDKDGEKQYMHFNHQFMFLNMKIWAYIFWVLGGILTLTSIAGLL